MNDSALQAITAPHPNKRQTAVLALARLCLATYPAVKHPGGYRVLVQALLIARSERDNELKLLLDTEKTIGQFVNDVLDIWRLFLSDKSLLR